MRSFPISLALAAFSFFAAVSADAENYIYRGSTKIIDWDRGTSRLQPRYLIVGDFVKVSEEVSTATISWIEFGGALGIRKMSYILPLEVRFVRSSEGRGAAFVFPQRQTTPSEESTTLMVLHGVTAAGARVPARLEGGYNAYFESLGAKNPAIIRTVDAWYLDRGLSAASNRAEESQSKAFDRVLARLEAAGFISDP